MKLEVSGDLIQFSKFHFLDDSRTENETYGFLKHQLFQAWFGQIIVQLTEVLKKLRYWSTNKLVYTLK